MAIELIGSHPCANNGGRREMNKTVKAKYANGALTPLERLDLADGSVVMLTIEELPADEGAPDEPESLAVSDDSEPLIDLSDPRALKKLLDDEELAHYLRSAGREQ